MFGVQRDSSHFHLNPTKNFKNEPTDKAPQRNPAATIANIPSLLQQEAPAMLPSLFIGTAMSLPSLGSRIAAYIRTYRNGRTKERLHLYQMVQKLQRP